MEMKADNRNENKEIKNSTLKSSDIDILTRLKLNDSTQTGKECFAKLISPIPVSNFYKKVWEKRPLYVARHNASYYEYVCTLGDFRNALEMERIHFSENVDVTSYVNGVKIMENLEGRVTPRLVRNLCKNGKSLRLLNPQTFIKKVRYLTTQLQEYFRCFVGANIYLTPGNCQGFAPHYDDVEAFVLQLAGRKEWKIYHPRQGEDLPRFSSGNFTDADIGEPILRVILEPGDLIYFPRGVIHQAQSLEEGSMHITVSCYQRNSWADFLEKLLPVALQRAVDEDVAYRKGLPRNYLDHLGLVASDSNSKSRGNIVSHLQALVHNLSHYLPIDSCADQFGKKFVHDALPPILDEDEIAYAANAICTGLREKLLHNWKKNLKVKLIRAYTCRLVCEEEKFKLYYNTRNGLNYHEVGHRFIPLSSTSAIMAETLIKRYPNFTSLKNLLSIICKRDGLDNVLRFIEKLWRRRLIIFNRPMHDK